MTNDNSDECGNVWIRFEIASDSKSESMPICDMHPEIAASILCLFLQSPPEEDEGDFDARAVFQHTRHLTELNNPMMARFMALMHHAEKMEHRIKWYPVEDPLAHTSPELCPEGFDPKQWAE
jgi:hypothetical protein